MATFALVVRLHPKFVPMDFSQVALEPVLLAIVPLAKKGFTVETLLQVCSALQELTVQFSLLMKI